MTVINLEEHRKALPRYGPRRMEFRWRSHLCRRRARRQLARYDRPGFTDSGSSERSAPKIVAAGRAMTTISRPYQHNVIEEFHHASRLELLHHFGRAHGSGKTIVGADIIQDQTAWRGKAVMVLAHRREIVRIELFELRISHGIIQVGIKRRQLELVQVASIQTLWKCTSHTNTDAATTC